MLQFHNTCVAIIESLKAVVPRKHEENTIRVTCDGVPGGGVDGKLSETVICGYYHFSTIFVFRYNIFVSGIIHWKRC